MKKLLTLFAVTTLLLVACKKDEKIEKNLWKGDGIWNIESYHSSETSSDGSSDFSETISNVGTFTFKKDGTGIVKFVYDGDVDMTSFSYSNTTETLTLTIDGEQRIFTMDWKKNKMTLSITENYSSGGVSYTYTEKMELSKQ